MITFRTWCRWGLYCLLSCVLPLAAAQGYPDKPVRIIVGFPPGQGTDIIARTIAQQLSASTGQQFYVENKAGAAGIIGTEFVKNAKPDGYTLLFTSSGPMAINPSLYKHLSYDPARDFAPVGVAATVPLLLAVNPNVPAKTVPEFVDFIKKHPGEYAYGSGGNGVTGNLAFELLKGMTGMDLRHIPYKGSPPALTDLIAGRVQAMFDSPLVLMPYYKSGKIKVIGVATSARIPNEPEIPTIAEQGFKDFEAVTWVSLFAPAGTPPGVIQKLNQQLNAAVHTPGVASSLAKLGAEPTTGTPEELSTTLNRDIAKWAQAVKLSGLKIE